MSNTQGATWLADEHQVQSIAELFKALRLPTARRLFEELHAQAPSQGWSAMGWLQALLEHEVSERADRRRASRTKESGLSLGKTLETFDFSLVSGITRQQAHGLSQGGEWIDRASNILLFGPSGSGKTHLATAIAHGLIAHGHRVYYSPTTIMLQKLTEAKREARLPQALEKLDRFDVIILDDIGYADKNEVDTGLLFDLIADRYESRSLVIASNKPFSGWEDVFPDNARCVAAIDRLVHHSAIFEIQGESYRRRQAQVAAGE